MEKQDGDLGNKDSKWFFDEWSRSILDGNRVAAIITWNGHVKYDEMRRTGVVMSSAPEMLQILRDIHEEYARPLSTASLAAYRKTTLKKIGELLGSIESRCANG